MIPLQEINKFSKQYGVPAETIEKDYVICWILRCLSRGFIRENFIFYGGTAIKRMHFENHRFSEDVDLISAGIFSQKQIIADLNDRFVQAKSLTNLALSLDTERILAKGTRLQIYVNYDGYEEIIGAPKEVRFDFAMGMDLYGNVETGTVFDSYSDLKDSPTHFPVMTLNTILASKLGLLISSSRTEPRDLYDVWFLLQRLDQFEFDQKAMEDAFKAKYGFSLSPSVIEPHLKNAGYRQNWETRLARQLADLPSIDSVIRETTQGLKKIWGEDT